MGNERKIDEVLVLRFQAGDRETFNVLARKYRHRLIRVVLPMVQNLADAEDVVQEALIRAYRALPTFRCEAAFYTWLFQIAVNAAKSWRKQQSRCAEISVQLELDDDEQLDGALALVDDQTPLTVLESKQAVSAVHRAVASLPPKLSATLLCWEFEDMSYAEIADAMCCPVGTVRSRVSRARDLIAMQLFPFIDTPTGRLACTE
jgi:RNA polymerase sigma-70 factor, ECF subfamily